jgi:hypothetical protein
MSKGSSPRNNHSEEFRDNYDNIDWSNPKDVRALIEDCPIINQLPQDSDEPLDLDGDDTEEISCSNE